MAKRLKFEELDENKKNVKHLRSFFNDINKINKYVEDKYNETKEEISNLDKNLRWKTF